MELTDGEGVDIVLNSLAGDAVERGRHVRILPVIAANRGDALAGRSRVAADDAVFGTPDTWVVWNLTGGPDGGVHATDPSNASRTSSRK